MEHTIEKSIEEKIENLITQSLGTILEKNIERIFEKNLMNSLDNIVSMQLKNGWTSRKLATISEFPIKICKSLLIKGLKVIQLVAASDSPKRKSITFKKMYKYGK